NFSAGNQYLVYSIPKPVAMAMSPAPLMGHGVDLMRISMEKWCGNVGDHSAFVRRQPAGDALTYDPSGGPASNPANFRWVPLPAGALDLVHRRGIDFDCDWALEKGLYKLHYVLHRYPMARPDVKHIKGHVHPC